jgi:hypothetical protein
VTSARSEDSGDGSDGGEDDTTTMMIMMLATNVLLAGRKATARRKGTRKMRKKRPLGEGEKVKESATFPSSRPERDPFLYKRKEKA